MNEVFSETNEELFLSSESADMSFTLDNDYESDKNELNESTDTDGDDISLEGEAVPAVQSETKTKKKIIAAPHKKRKVVRSQNQGLSQLAKGVEDMNSSQMKRTQMMIEADVKRDELFLKHKAEEAEKNREHELRLAQVYSAMFTRYAQPQPPQSIPHWQNSSSVPPQDRHHYFPPNNLLVSPRQSNVTTSVYQSLSPPGDTSTSFSGSWKDTLNH